MADPTQRAVDLYGGAVALVPGGVTVRDKAKLRTAATDRLAWQAVFGKAEEREKITDLFTLEETSEVK